MKSSAIRSQRGRPNKVTKPAAAARGRAPRLPAGHLAGAVAHEAATQQQQHDAALHDHHQQHHHHHDPEHDQDHGHEHEHDPSQDYDPALDDSVKADPASVFDDVAMSGQDYAAAAAAAAAMDTDLTEDAHGDAEADLDDDDGTGAAPGLPPHVDLTAASILANGGAGGPGGPMSQSAQEQLQEMQQNLAHAHQHHNPHHPHPHPHPHQHHSQAQMGPPQQMQPGHQALDPSMVKTTEELAAESGYGELNVESALAKRLAREPGLRLAQQRRPEQVLNLARRSNVEALFAHIAGEPARVPCKNCHKGHGPWTSCIVVDGQMCGSCANCWFNASGARCSFHETRNPQITAPHPAILPAGTATLASDPASAYRFAAAAHHHPLLHSPATAATAAGTLVGVNAHAPQPPPGLSAGALLPPGTSAIASSSPLLQQMVGRALADVRAADKATRQLMLIDATAKQLAVQIAEYEEMVGVGVAGVGVAGGGQDPQGQQQGQQQQQGGQGQQVMGDEQGP